MPLLQQYHSPVEQKRGTSRMSSSTLGLLMTGTFALVVIWQVYTHDRMQAAAIRYGDLVSSPADLALSPADLASAPADLAPRKALAQSSPAIPDMCHVEQKAEYVGSAITTGEDKKTDTHEECCNVCSETDGCNVWLWCGEKTGCSAGTRLAAYGECLLMSNTVDTIFEKYRGRGGGGSPWTSGALYSAEEEAVQMSKLAAINTANAERIQKLKDDEDLPWVWMDVAINGTALGRIEAILYIKDAPLAAENHRRFHTGEMAQKNGDPFTLKGAAFYRIIDRFIDQSGASGGSTFGGAFRDDPGGLKFQHDRPYLLSLANGGPDTNSGHFFITLGPAHHLDGKYTIFGELIAGFDVAERVNVLSRGHPPSNELYSQWAKITDVGQLRRGIIMEMPDHRPLRNQGAHA